MSAPRLAVAAAAVAVTAWVVKGIAIAVAGGLDQSPLEAPLFLIGMLALVVALVAFAFAMTDGRPVWRRAAAAVAAVVIGVALVLVAQAISRGVLPDSTDWVEEEAGLWIGSAVIAAGIAASLRRRGRPMSPGTGRRRSA